MSRADRCADDADTLWFPSLVEVPGLSYTAPQNMDRAALPGHDAVPRFFEYGFDDESERSRTWSTPSGEMDAFPAHQRAFGGVEKIGARDELRSLREALELPGSLSDYHLAIQRAAEAAYKGRRKEPALIGEAKRLWWLGVDLVETHPSTVRHLQGEITEWTPASG